MSSWRCKWTLNQRPRDLEPALHVLRPNRGVYQDRTGVTSAKGESSERGSISGTAFDILIRCHRLRKPCGSQTPAPPRAKKDPKPTKVAELEKRLNELTTQLGTTQGGTPAVSAGAITAGENGNGNGSGSGSGGGVIDTNASPLPITNSSKPVSARIPINCDHLFPPEDAPADGGSDTSPAPSASTLDEHHSGSSHGQPERVEPPWPLNNELNIMLQTFRDDFQPLYPFVIVPPHMSPAQLAAERPYLWKGIMMTASHLDATRQVTLGNELLGDIVQAAFTKPKKSLDVLQGLQLLVSWYEGDIDTSVDDDG